MVVPPGNEASVCRALADIEDDATLEEDDCCSEDGLLVVCEEEECCWTKIRRDLEGEYFGVEEEEQEIGRTEEEEATYSPLER